jgi:hypothetical protein
MLDPLRERSDISYPARRGRPAGASYRDAALPHLGGRVQLVAAPDGRGRLDGVHAGRMSAVGPFRLSYGLSRPLPGFQVKADR